MNENENTVRLLIPEPMAHAILAVIGHGMTSQVCEDLGLGPLYTALHDKLGRTHLEAVARTSLLARENREIPVSVTVEGYPRYTSIDLT